MNKFIWLTFGFLAYAFYEMSGGADFEPASVRMAAQAPTKVPNVRITELSKPPTIQPDVAQVTDTAPRLASRKDADTVTSVSLNLTTLSKTAQTRTEALEPENELPVSNGNVISSADTPAIIPSLIMPNDTRAATQLNLETLDVREVTGNRVNVRGGPGKDYGVVTKLLRGDAVEILEDRGDGWVRLRPLGGGPEGWMADFLLTNG